MSEPKWLSGQPRIVKQPEKSEAVRFAEYIVGKADCLRAEITPEYTLWRKVGTDKFYTTQELYNKFLKLKQQHD